MFHVKRTVFFSLYADIAGLCKCHGDYLGELPCASRSAIAPAQKGNDL